MTQIWNHIGNKSADDWRACQLWSWPRTKWFHIQSSTVHGCW